MYLLDSSAWLAHLLGESATDVTIAQAAIRLRVTTLQRLPTIDSLIAATAAVHGLTLVHRDPHLAAIPTSVLKQIKLPEK
jgi:predicted nucleic acid-binding protein